MKGEEKIRSKNDFNGTESPRNDEAQYQWNKLRGGGREWKAEYFISYRKVNMT